MAGDCLSSQVVIKAGKCGNCIREFVGVSSSCVTLFVKCVCDFFATRRIN